MIFNGFVFERISQASGLNTLNLHQMLHSFVYLLNHHAPAGVGPTITIISPEIAHVHVLWRSFGDAWPGLNRASCPGNHSYPLPSPEQFSFPSRTNSPGSCFPWTTFEDEQDFPWINKTCHPSGPSFFFFLPRTRARTRNVYGRSGLDPAFSLLLLLHPRVLRPQHLLGLRRKEPVRVVFGRAGNTRRGRGPFVTPSWMFDGALFVAFLGRGSV